MTRHRLTVFWGLVLIAGCAAHMEEGERSPIQPELETELERAVALSRLSGEDEIVTRLRSVETGQELYAAVRATDRGADEPIESTLARANVDTYLEWLESRVGYLEDSWCDQLYSQHRQLRIQGWQCQEHGYWSECRFYFEMADRVLDRWSGSCGGA